MAEKYTRKGFDTENTATVATDSSFPVAVGDLVCVMVTGQEGGTITSVTDTAGNTYTALTAQTTFTLAQIFYTFATAAHASNIVTANFTAAVRYKVISLASHDGVDSYITEGSGLNAGATVVTTGSMSVGGTAPLLFWVAVASNDRSWTPGGGGTEIYDSNVAIGAGGHGSAWLYPGGTGSITVSSTADSASNLEIAAAAFLPGGGGGASTAALMQYLNRQRRR